MQEGFFFNLSIEFDKIISRGPIGIFYLFKNHEVE